MTIASAKRRARNEIREKSREAVVVAAIAAFPTIERNRFLNDEMAALNKAVLELMAVL